MRLNFQNLGKLIDPKEAHGYDAYMTRHWSPVLSPPQCQFVYSLQVSVQTTLDTCRKTLNLAVDPSEPSQVVPVTIEVGLHYNLGLSCTIVRILVEI